MWPPRRRRWLDKLRPADGSPLLPRRSRGRCSRAVAAARAAQPGWAERTPVERGDVVRAIARALRERREEALRDRRRGQGKVARARARRDRRRRARWDSSSPARGAGRTAAPTTASIATPYGADRPRTRRRGGAHHLLQHAASERRLEGVSVHPLRQRVGAEALGGDAGLGALLRARSPSKPACRRASSMSSTGSARGGLPLVESPDVDLVSFTGSAATGRRSPSARAPGSRRRASSSAARTRSSSVTMPTSIRRRWTLASAFSNAGQRCAAASRIVVFDAIYDRFRERCRG